MHEMGHVGGLGQSKRLGTIMYTGHLTGIGSLTTYDTDAMKAVYSGHSSH